MNRKIITEIISFSLMIILTILVIFMLTKSLEYDLKVEELRQEEFKQQAIIDYKCYSLSENEVKQSVFCNEWMN